MNNITVTDENKHLAIALIKRYNDGTYIGGRAPSLLKDILGHLSTLEEGNSHKNMAALEAFTIGLIEFFVNHPESFSAMTQNEITDFSLYLISLDKLFNNLSHLQASIDTTRKHLSEITNESLQDELEAAAIKYNQWQFDKSSSQLNTDEYDPEVIDQDIERLKTELLQASLITDKQQPYA